MNASIGLRPCRDERQALITRYKAVLRGFIEQRPSGVRRKIAQALGTHKSFISQITNPSDPTPIPARHLATISDVCHLSAPERKRFFDAYERAHAGDRPAAPETLDQPPSAAKTKTLQLQIPVLENPHKQRALENYIRDSVNRLCNLVHD